MSKAPDITTAPSSSAAKLPFDLDWITRPVFGIALAALAVGSLIAGTWPFAIVVAVASIASAREWHRMVEGGVFAREFWITAVTLLGALALLAWQAHQLIAWYIIVAGTILVALSALARQARWLWHASGVAYLGIPALLMVSLRALAPQGAWVLIGLFLVVWATDTGALILGNLIKGPKLVPLLSPNKTWSGTIGGVVAASITAAIYVGVLGGQAGLAAAFAACLSVIAHGGDLFESFVKRRFQIKNSGGLIPGHGGALDRIDSTLAASTAMAFAVFALHLDPMFGAHP